MLAGSLPCQCFDLAGSSGSPFSEAPKRALGIGAQMSCWHHRVGWFSGQCFDLGWFSRISFFWSTNRAPGIGAQIGLWHHVGSK